MSAYSEENRKAPGCGASNALFPMEERVKWMDRLMSTSWVICYQPANKQLQIVRRHLFHWNDNVMVLTVTTGLRHRSAAHIQPLLWKCYCRFRASIHEIQHEKLSDQITPVYGSVYF